jgi:hypothetical protein
LVWTRIRLTFGFYPVFNLYHISCFHALEKSAVFLGLFNGALTRMHWRVPPIGAKAFSFGGAVLQLRQQPHEGKEERPNLQPPLLPFFLRLFAADPLYYQSACRSRSQHARALHRHPRHAPVEAQRQRRIFTIGNPSRSISRNTGFSIGISRVGPADFMMRLGGAGEPLPPAIFSRNVSMVVSGTKRR